MFIQITRPKAIIRYTGINTITYTGILCVTFLFNLSLKHLSMSKLRPRILFTSSLSLWNNLRMISTMNKIVDSSCSLYRNYAYYFYFSYYTFMLYIIHMTNEKTNGARQYSSSLSLGEYLSIYNDKAIGMALASVIYENEHGHQVYAYGYNSCV